MLPVCRLPLVLRAHVILPSQLGRESMRLYANDSNSWWVIIDVKTKNGHTHIHIYVHHGTRLRGYASNLVRYWTWNIQSQRSNVMIARMEDITKKKESDIRVQNGREMILGRENMR